MLKSYNGWPASPDRDDLDLLTFMVPGVPDRKFTTVRVAAPLFAYVIRRFDEEVDRLPGGVFDEWSYAFRPARSDEDLISCHGSATAVDLDATEFPMGVSRMTPVQRSTTRGIVSACRGEIRWGGEFRPPWVDEMHFELAKGTRHSTVKETVRIMGLHPDGRVVRPGDIVAGGNATRIRLVKKALAARGVYPRRLAYSGKWNARLGEALLEWTARFPNVSEQARLDRLGSVTHLF